MKVEVRGGTKEENRLLKKLTEDSFRDSGLGKKQKNILMISDIGVPAFYVACKFKKDVEPILLSDISKIRQQSNKTRLQITQERYYDEVIKKLWKKYGTENVEQSERNVIFVNTVDDDIKNIMIYDLTEEIRERTIDILWSILPEGFKIRHFRHFNDGFILIATDVPQIKDFVDTIDAIQKEFGDDWNV